MFVYLTILSLLCHCYVYLGSKVSESSPYKEHHFGGGSDPEFNYEVGEHLEEFDHNAFLGKDELFKLDKIFHTADGRIREDGLVTEDELTNWLEYTKRHPHHIDTSKQFKKYDLDKDGEVTWDEYKKVYWKENDIQKEYNRILLGHDEKRYMLADQNSDGRLNVNELYAFLYPEDNKFMIEEMVNETIEEIDEDNDGFINLQEYLNDLDPSKLVERDWLKFERDQFTKVHDKNKDGGMDREEIKEWIVPHGNLRSDARQLISESDTNGDGKISNNEIMEKYYIFLSSQVMDLRGNKSRDEL